MFNGWLNARTYSKLVISWNGIAHYSVYPAGWILNPRHKQQYFVYKQVRAQYDAQSKGRINLWWEHVRLAHHPQVRGDIVLHRHHFAIDERNVHHFVGNCPLVRVVSDNFLDANIAIDTVRWQKLQERLEEPSET